MEDNNTNQPKKDSPDDKTTVYSTVGKSILDDKYEKTLVVNSPIKEEKEEPKQQQDKESKISQKPDKSKKVKKKGKFSAGAFAAGVAGAAVAGTALGTVFSDEIKDVFHVDSSDAPVVSDGTTPEVNPDSPDSNTILTNLLGTGDTSGSIMPEGVSSIEVSGTDNAGNIFSVSLMDLNSDGIADIEIDSIEFADGSLISYLEIEGAGSFLSFDQSQLATPTDYMGGFTDIMGTPTHSYEIQPGDTLSEVAAANNTSIEHLMELNPGITDPDLIYAHNELVIPDNDNISNPYQTDFLFEDQSGIVSDSTPLLTPDVSGDALVTDEIAGIDITSSVDEPVSEANFEQVDWTSFSEEPVLYDDSVYGEALLQTDFESYETPDNYVDNSYFESGNDFVSSEFM